VLTFIILVQCTISLRNEMSIEVKRLTARGERAKIGQYPRRNIVLAAS
jgi:hypothetical protein